MNIDIRNYGNYRVTSHGGRMFDLYNRVTGDVFSISRKDWDYICSQEYPRLGCEDVEAVYKAARKPNGLDVA